MDYSVIKADQLPSILEDYERATKVIAEKAARQEILTEADLDDLQYRAGRAAGAKIVLEAIENFKGQPIKFLVHNLNEIMSFNEYHNSESQIERTKGDTINRAANWFYERMA